MLRVENDYPQLLSPPLPFSVHLSVGAVLQVLSALSHMLIYIAVLEFICSQSPHSMKGLLIGLFYAIKGLYQVFAALLVFCYVTLLRNFFHDYIFSAIHLDSEFFYYLVNIVIGVAALLLFVCVARGYRNRVRDEPCNIHRYAEEYYSNPQQEQYYDYD